MDKEELQGLRQELNPGKPSHLSESTALLPNTAAVTSTSSHKRMQSWSEDREAMMTRNLRWLKEQIVRANLMAKEAGFKAEELNKNTEYLVILQITAANLNANRKREVVLSEPAVQVRRKGKGKQIWALEKMENRLVDMRELYQEWKDFDEDNHAMWAYFKRADPFFDEQENHSLIGVANIFLACLINDVKLQYAAPIINQKGEVAGRLHVEVWRGTEGSDEKSQTDAVGDSQERKLDCVVKILQASGLQRHLSNFVFCEYHFWGQEEPVFIPPEVAPSSSSSTSRDPQCNVVFDIAKEFSVPVSEDFVEFLAEGAVAIEVYGHKKANYCRNLALWDLGVIQAKTRSLEERWSEVTRQLEMWVHVMELNEAGKFTPVEVLPAKDVHTGGIFQLQQGQSRRVQVEVRSVQDSGTMPLIATSILSVSIGDVMVRQACLSKDSESQWSGDEEMDSYQEVDLERMRKQWLDTLTQRQEYLDQQLQKIVCKPDKSEDDVERESQLLECRLMLTEERNAVLVPSPGSGIPGAPGERVPVPGMETHIPVLFLDLSADDFQSSLSAPLAGGLDALLSREDSDGFFDLYVAKHYDPEVKVEASWDSTVHECPQLSRVMLADRRVYLTVSAGVQLSHPAHMQLVLRKRICVNVTGRQGFAQSLLKKISQRSTIPGCGVTYEIVSNIPGDIHGPEDREMLARLAASTGDGQSADSESAIEKYLRSVLAVENIITLDRLRQEVAVKEQLAVRGKACLSSPNINQGWESHHNLSAGLNSSRRTLPISHSLHTETVKAVPKLLKSLLPGWKEDSRTQTIVHQQVLIEEIFPRDLQKESPISVPLPPPIIPETEESTPSPVSEVSSGYISTSLSTVTLSDVYRLSWDLPPWSSSGAYGFEALPDDEQEDNKDICPESSLMDQSEPVDLLVVLDNEAAEQSTDLTPSKPDNSPNDSSLSQQEPNQSPSLQLKEQGETNLVAKSDQLCQAKQKQDSIYHAGSEQLHKLASITDSLIEEENETKQTHVSPTDPSRLNTLLTEELELIAKEQKDSELPLCLSPSESNISESQPSKEEQTTINSAKDPAADLISNESEDIPSSSPLGDFVLPALSEKQATFEATKPNASSIPTPSPTTEVPAPVSTSPKTAIDPDLPLSSIQGSKSFSSVANPFKIKKVKSSDLKSFQRIIGKDKDSPVQVELSSSVGAELHLSVPMESLEMISDSEEGDASAKTVLPEWLKEGEFVTVGTNKSGTVRYVGPTNFAEGTWVGVELELPAGKNDGSVGGKYYFHCNPGYGVLVRPNRVGLGGTKRHRQQHHSANLSGSSPNLAALTVLAKGESVGTSVYHGRGKNRKSWNT